MQRLRSALVLLVCVLGIHGNGTELIGMTAEELARSVLTPGGCLSSQRIARVIAERRCARIVVIGGSVSCGVAWNHPDMPRGKEDAWPALLLARLEAEKPCEGGHHVLENACKGAVGSDYWVDWVEVSLPELGGADLVLVDTSVNDAAETTAKHMERLLFLLQHASSPPPSVLVVGTSTMYRPGYPLTDIPRRCAECHDVLYEQAEVAKRFGVGVVSVVDALDMFATRGLDWFIDSFLADGVRGNEGGGVHPTKAGHRAVAEVAWNWVLTARADCVAEEPARLAGGDALLEGGVTSVNTTCDACDARFRTFAAGFVLAEDARGKRGRIAEAVGDFIEYSFPRGFRRVHVILLKSYESMGTASIRISAPGGRVVAEEAVDCLWDDPVSEAVVHEMSTGRGDGQLTVRIAVAESSPPRQRNKVKLLGITAFGGG